MEFTMLEDVEFVPETASAYAKGMSYTVRTLEQCDLPKNASDKLRATVATRCEALARLAPQWVAEGKAVWGRLPQTVSGTGG